MTAARCNTAKEQGLRIRSDVDHDSLLGLAEFRADMYRFFSAVFNRPMDQRLIESLLGEDFMELAEGFASADSIALLKKAVREWEHDPDELRYEYNNLFIVPGGRYVTPYESVYRGTRIENGREVLGLLNGAETREVQQAYRSMGFQLDPKKIGPPDFIGTEMEFMRQVALMEQEAWQAKDQEQALLLLKMQKDFLDEHLHQWLPTICEKIAERTRSSVYQAIAAITKDFDVVEAQTLSEIFVSSAPRVETDL